MSKEAGKPRYLSLVVPLKKVGDEAVHKELGDRMERASTTTSSLEAEQDSGSGPSVLKLMLLNIQFLLLVYINAAKLMLILLGSVNAVRHMLMLPVQVPAAEESDGFAGIINFLKASSVHYALTVNPIIYTSCIEQFWATAKIQTFNGVRQLQALVDKKRVTITESSIRCDLHLEDEGGTDCLPTTTIFEELARMGAKSTAWDEFSSTMASLITCLVLDLEKAKDAQAKEIADLRKRVQRLEMKKKSRTTGLRKLKKVGMSKRVESSKDQESLGDHEDASKQGRSIEDIDADAEVTLVNETEERQDDDLMFDTGVLDDDKVFVDVTTVAKEEHGIKTGEAVTTAGVEDSVYVDDIIFGLTNKELCTGFEKLMKDKFQMSSMGELTFFLGLQVQQKEDGIFISQDKYVVEILKKFNYSDVKSASNPVDLEKPLVKDRDADDVDVHLCRSMIRSLMYLTASRPDIMDSPFELVAYTDSNYAGATLDRKST
ncbi:putative ribonuclease H-like domain-containing protein, partial [Tanacetum coccineum]